MQNIIRFRWMPFGLRRRALPLAFVVGAGFCLMATSTRCFAQQNDGSTRATPVAEMAPVVLTVPHPSDQNGPGKEWIPSKVQEIVLQIFLQFLFAGVLGGLFTFLLSCLLYTSTLPTKA